MKAGLFGALLVLRALLRRFESQVVLSKTINMKSCTFVINFIQTFRWQVAGKAFKGFLIILKWQMPCAMENEYLMRTQWLKIMKLSHLNFCAKIVILVTSIVIFFNYVKMRLFERIFKHCDRIKYWFEGFIEKKNNMNFGVNSDLDNFDIVKSHSIMKSRLPWGQKVSGKWRIKYLKSVHSETKGRQSSNIHIQILMSQ